MDVDDVYIRTGEFGYFQWKVFSGCFLGAWFAGTQMVQNIFAGSVPNNMSCLDSHFNACDAGCPSIVYLDDELKSFAMEWNMTCGPSIAAAQNTQALFVLGVMIGSFFVGGLGDKFGRFPVVLACQFLCGLFGLLSSFALNWNVYVGLRLMTGFFLSGIIIIGFVLTSELVGPSKRGVIGAMPGLAFALGISTLSLVSWFTKDWKVMSIIFGIVGIVCTIPCYWLFVESPRWYLGKGNVEKCKLILKKIAKTNGHDLGDIELKVPSKGDASKKGSKTSMLSLLTNGTLRKITAIQLVSWFTCSSVYYGLTIAAGNMGDNRYISVILNSMVEVPSNIAILYIMNIPRCGRVKSCVGGLIISSIFCGSIWFIPDKHTLAVTGLACAGKLFICAAFATIYVHAGELYPTPVRNLGLGVISVANRLGGVMAPLIVNLNNIYHNAHFVVFGVVGCLAGVLCLLLPETLGRPLPESPEEIYQSSKEVKIVSLELEKSDKRPLLLSDMLDEGADVDT